MAIKNENEITVKVIGTKDELINLLKLKGFKCIEKFSLDDCYFVPGYLDLASLTAREILSKCVIVRDITSDTSDEKKITFKMKEFDCNGDIKSQSSVNCKIYDIDEAKGLLVSMGYKELMNIKEDDTVYSDGRIELAVKEISGGDILIEVETNSELGLDTIEKLKEEISKFNLPIDNIQYFVKKAEIELEKILCR